MKRDAVRSGILFGCLVFSLSAAAFLILAEPVRLAVPETDNWWMVPAFSRYIEGLGPWARLRFVLSRYPYYINPPPIKAALWLIDDFLRLPAWGFPLAGLWIHGLTAVGLAWLCRLMGLSLRIAAASALIFACSFVHFHGFLWLPASQHPQSLLTVLATLCLFLETERRIGQGRRSGPFLALTALAALAGSLQHSWFLSLPLMVGATWVIPGLSLAHRRQLFNRWLPVWCLCLVYPLIRMARFRDLTAVYAVSEWPFPPWLKAAALLLAGAGLLFGVRWMLRFRRFSAPAAVAAGLVLWAGLALRDSRQLLLPYNGLVPWMTVLGSFLDPLRVALQMDATDSYYFIPPQVSVFHLFFALSLCAFFFSLAREKRLLLLWGGWYAIVAAYLLLQRHVASSMPLRTPSRYFLYVTPFFSVVFACGLLHGLEAVCRKTGWGKGKKDLLLAGLLLAFCLPNLLAVRVALFRGRLTNTYLVYDDLRTARLIREDLARSGGSPPAPGGLQIQNAVPTLFSRMRWEEPLDYSQIGHENLRRFLEEAFGDRRMRAARVNEPLPAAAAANTYRIEGERILDAQGRSIEPFDRLLSLALNQLAEGKREAAIESFRQAALERPFLLNYLLGRPLRLADLQWITGPEDFRSFFETIDARHRRWGVGPAEKVRRTSELIRGELSRYLLCLFCLSALEQEAGHPEQSRFWLSQIGFIERTPDALAEWLGRIPEVGSTGPLCSFLEKVRDPLAFREPLVWKKEDYAVGRFLVRLVLHRDIRSSWDKQRPAIP